MNVGIVGANGFLGKNLCEELALRDHDVSKLGRTWYGGALSYDTVANFAKDCDVIVHLATIDLRRSIGDPVSAVQDILGMTMNLLQFARWNGTFMVNCSTSEVYGTSQEKRMSENHPRRPCTPYAAAKAAQDMLFDSYYKTYGVEYFTFRPFNMWGPHCHLTGDRAEVLPRMILRGLKGQSLQVAGDGTQSRDFIHVKSACEIICDLIERKNEIVGEEFNICTGHPTSIIDLATMLSDIMKVPISFLPKRPADVQRHCGDNMKLGKFLGAIPYMAITESTLKELIAHIKERVDGETLNHGAV